MNHEGGNSRGKNGLPVFAAAGIPDIPILLIVRFAKRSANAGAGIGVMPSVSTADELS
jgi:hypothetical protein